jgi:Tfp pilus assembly ATPase PilU
MGSISQRLVKRSSGKGRIAINEIMMVTSTIRDYIRKNELEAIYELMASGFNDDNVSLNRALYQAFQNKDISYEDALETSENKQEFMLMVRGMYDKYDNNDTFS